MDLVLPRTDVGAKEKERNLFRVVISKVAGVLLLSMLFAPLVLVMVMVRLFLSYLRKKKKLIHRNV